MEKLYEHKLCELYSIHSGISSAKDQAGHGYSFLSFKTVFDNYFIPKELPDLMDCCEKDLEQYSVKRGDLFLTRTSETVDELAMSSVALQDQEKATFSGFLKRLRPKQEEKICPEFAGFYFRSPYFRRLINNYTTLTTRASFNEDIFSFLKVYLPEYHSQEKIGHTLYLIEQKIENNNCINDNLAQMLRLLYEQWFYRFEFPNEQNLPYNRANGELEWNDKLKRRIPKGWKVQTMLSNELFSVISSGIDRFSTKKYYATADIIGSSIGEGSDIEYETRESRANMQPVINSVWFAKMKNSIKHLYLNKEMNSFVNNSILSTGFYGLKCNEISFEYIASVVSAPIFEITKDRLSHGATQQGIGDDDMANITLLIPDDTTLRKYHEATKGFFAKISNNILENKRLMAIRNFLLPLLMNGQVAIAE